MASRHLCAAFVLLIAAAMLSADEAPDSPWPLDIPYGSGVITLYQPQPEKLEGNLLTGRAAASYLPTGKGEDDRVFGALWFTATLDIDRENDVAKARTMTISKVLTAKGEKTGETGDAIKKAISDAVLGKGIEIDLDRLVATIEEIDDDGAANFNTTPPRILIREDPTVLVVLDGEPKQQVIDDVKRVVNSPAFLAVDGTGAWWLRGDRDWLTAPTIDGPWAVPSASPTPAIVAAAKKAGFSTVVARAADSKAPAVIIAKEPTELIVFDGKPSFGPVGADGALLADLNSDTDVLIEVATNKYFVLLAGRWYSTSKLTADTTWDLVKPDALPAAFLALPDTADWKDVRAHVAGTPEAKEAVAQQQIPQTARIPRTATITVTFDGEPKWVKVKDLPVDYAENCADAVFRLPGPVYYVCRDGVWYESKVPTGPFTVATKVPDALRKLPADNPWHNTTYVTIYESTPDYVWCGYTPGYMGWYAWYGCPIYGTGWWYHGWYGSVCYPRPVTWGVGIHYNPWTGWGVSVGVVGAHWAVAWSSGGHYGGGWWGCGGVNNINIDNSINVGNGIGNGNGGIGNGNRPGNLPANRPPIYDRVPGAERPKLDQAGDRMRGNGTRPAAGQLPTAGQQPRRDNLAVDRDGTIGRPTGDGSWQTRQDGAWKERPAARPATTPANRPATTPANRPATTPAAKPATRPASSFENTQQMRNRGEQRVQQRSMPAYGGGGSGSRGGGGGGRGGGRGGGGRR